MFPRIASLLQIALLLGCPCWCKADLCAAHDSELTTTGAKAADRPASTQHCCCCHAKPRVADNESDSSESAPSPGEPNSAPCECQCICGGAVLGEPVASVSSADVRDLPLLVIDASPQRGAHDDSHLSNSRGLSLPGAYTGRELRHLISSLLC